MKRAALVGSLLLLAGCAATPSPAQQPSPTPTPTAACPRVDDIPDSERDCAVYDPDAAMAQNELYREQLPVDAATQARLDTYVEPARAVLVALPAPTTVEAVIAALASVGLDERSIQTLGGDGTGIGFGAAAEGGCVTGSITVDGAVEVSAGGFISDGGCLAMTGH